MIRYYVLSLACLLCLSASAQTTRLTGIVRDSTDRTALVGATVQVLADSSTKLYALTDAEGRFSFSNLAPRPYLLKITYIGYRDLNRRIRVPEAGLDLGTVSLTSATSTLNEVRIVGQVPPATQKGDTIQFNANAFKTNPDATAEDLVQKMPGIQVENGTVKAQGEDVRRVLVDGREFFGDDATLALKNLPAEVIDKIEVFDRLSEQAQFSGFDDGQTQKTLNIITRPDRRGGQFGRFYAGAGTQETYQAGGNLNLFNGKHRWSLLGLSNNINQQNFSSQDLLGVQSASSGGGPGGGRGGRGGGGGNFGGGNASGNFLTGSQSGITTTNSLGLNYDGQWGKKWKVTGSYFFNHTANANASDLNRTYFLGALDNQIYREDQVSTNRNANHRLTARLEYTIDARNSLVITPRLSVQGNTASRFLNSQNLLDDETGLQRPLSTSSSQTNSRNDGFNASNNVLWRHRFAKRGRSLSVGLTTGLNDRAGTSILMARNEFFERDSLRLERLNQRTLTGTEGYNLGLDVVYTEPISRQGQLQFNYNGSYSNSATRRETFRFDELAGDYTLLDSTLSNRFLNDYLTHRAGTGYRFNNRKLNLMANLSYQRAELTGEQTFPGQFVRNRVFENVLPSAMVNVRFSPQTNLRLNYRTSTNPPSINQLQGVLNNSNPTQLSIGNPDLKQEYSHNLSARYSSNKAENGRSFMVFLNGGYTLNPITTATFLAQRDTVLSGVPLAPGVSLSRPVNLSEGQWRVGSFISYGIPIKALKTNLNLNTGLNFNRVPGLVNGLPNRSDSYGLNQGIALTSNISEKLDFSLSTNANYTIVQNTLQPQRNQNFYIQTSRGRINWIFGKGFVLQSDVTHQLYRGLVDGFNQDFLLANAGVAKKVFKKQNGELKLSVFDLFNQNRSISRNVTETYIEDARTQVLTRYAMLTFTYTLRNFKAGASTAPVDEPGERRFQRPPGMEGGFPGGGRPGGFPGGGRP
jgi:uncharacterized membrane protein YgcG